MIETTYTKASSAFIAANNLEELYSAGKRLKPEIEKECKTIQLWIRNAFIEYRRRLNEAQDCKLIQSLQ